MESGFSCNLLEFRATSFALTKEMTRPLPIGPADPAPDSAVCGSPGGVIALQLRSHCSDKQLPGLFCSFLVAFHRFSQVQLASPPLEWPAEHISHVCCLHPQLPCDGMPILLAFRHPKPDLSLSCPPWEMILE